VLGLGLGVGDPSLGDGGKIVGFTGMRIWKWVRVRVRVSRVKCRR